MALSAADHRSAIPPDAPGVESFAGSGRAEPVLDGMRLLPPSSSGQLRGGPWRAAELSQFRQGGRPDQRSVWFTGAGEAADALFQAQAERLAVGGTDLVVHMEGRDGTAYHAGRPVPAGVLADVLASLPVSFTRGVARACQAARGDPIQLPARLATRGQPGIGRPLSDARLAGSG